MPLTYETTFAFIPINGNNRISIIHKSIDDWLTGQDCSERRRYDNDDDQKYMFYRQTASRRFASTCVTSLSLRATGMRSRAFASQSTIPGTLRFSRRCSIWSAKHGARRAVLAQICPSRERSRARMTSCQALPCCPKPQASLLQCALVLARRNVGIAGSTRLVAELWQRLLASAEARDAECLSGPARA